MVSRLFRFSFHQTIYNLAVILVAFSLSSGSYGDAAESLLRQPPTQTSNPSCATTQRSLGSITVCINTPSDEATVSSLITVEASLTMTGVILRADKVIFSLNGEYLLTDFHVPYTFDLPTDHFADGDQTLSAVAVINDVLTSQPASVKLHFANNNRKISETPIFTPYIPPTPPPGQPLIIAAAGDGASGENPGVTDLIASWHPEMLLYLGDVYEKGTFTEFYNWYGTDTSYWGQFRAITNPTIGNHEYENGVAPGYFTYWNNIADYYSFDAGGWHFISLNSNLSKQTEPGDPQYEWLVQDLNTSRAYCTIAFFHHPRFSIGSQGDTPRLESIWSLMVRRGVDIVLTGHDHNYQRWEPIGAQGQPNSEGITEFVTGGGGHGIRPFVRSDSRVVKDFDSADETFGALRLELYNNRAVFQYQNMAGNVIDSGEVPCHDAPESAADFYVAGSVYANVRVCPNTQCSRVTNVAPGTEVTVTGEVSGQSVLGSTIWYEVLVGSVNGYMHSSTLTPVISNTG